MPVVMGNMVMRVMSVVGVMVRMMMGVMTAMMSTVMAAMMPTVPAAMSAPRQHARRRVTNHQRHDERHTSNSLHLTDPLVSSLLAQSAPPAARSAAAQA